MRIPPFRGVGVAVVVGALATSVPAHAVDYWTNSALLKEFFKTSAAAGPHSFTLTDADADAIGKALGAPLRKKTWSIYAGQDAAKKFTGYAILDDEVGLHEPIDFGVKFGLGGAVERVEIRAYREPYGDEVRSERFRQQFIGKTANDAILAGKDIDIVSGATFSSKAMALGVKRDALVLQAALKSGL